MLSKMQKVIGSIIVVIGTYIIPLFILNQSQNNSLELEKVQWGVFVILFLGSVGLTYLNYRNIATEKTLKWVWILFEVIGVLGVLYSVFALYIIYGFSHFGV